MIKMNRFNGIFFLLALLFSSAVGCSSKRILPDNPGPFERYTPEIVLHSEILGKDVKFGVLLPESYRDDADRRYPVVYMLHGYGDNHMSWNGKYLHANARIQALEKNGLSEMIYIFPAGYNSYYCNYYNGKYNYMDMFVKELVPHVDKSFRTVADREHRALTGYSMGGFGAMVLAEKHPELFSCSAPLSMSFRTDAQYMTEPGSGWDGQWGRIFGGVGQFGTDRLTDYYLDHNPYRQFCDANRTQLETVKWFFTCGDDEEQLLIANDSLHVILRDRSFAHEFRVENGAHTSSYWMDALNEVLPWMDCCMNGATSWPECSRAGYSKQAVSFEEDGSLKSSLFASEGNGTGVFFFYKGLSEQEVKEAMSVVYTPSTKANFIYLPCDLSKKSAEEWIRIYTDKYTISSRAVVAFGETGEDAVALRNDFVWIVLADASVPEFVTEKGQRWYFAQTDDSPFYPEMDNLYRSCKQSGATFEYRVIDGSGNATEDRLRELSKLRHYMTY